ncbi:methyltransferase domain-containing protein [Falsiroseomonas sp. CW058]|uniref:methyltransferase domain-containing protein n=1 Tax=Falsiroseomonas sp. CW058 TaxID=3388664 RepID=UPI003D3155FE
MSTAPAIPAAAPGPAGPVEEAALLSRVPMGVRLVALAGTGTAGLAAAIRRRDPAAQVVELRALPPGIPPLLRGSVDALVWPDVLARLADPAAALAQAAALLAPDGVLVAAVPNPFHWTFADRLLRGGWDPGGEGPLGPGHLRLFTPEAVGDALQGAGLVPLDMLPDGVEEEEAAAFARRIAPSLPALGVEAGALAARAAPRRHIWRAARRRATPLVVVAHVLKPVGGVNDVRIDLPLNAMATRPGVRIRIAQNPDTPALAAETPRIMLLHRRLLNGPDAAAHVQQFRRRGWVVVQEFDDDPAHWPVVAQSGHFAFRGVHAVQTTTPRLETLFRQYNGEVAVFPNTVAELPERRNFADPRRMTLFLGALRREDDIAPFLPALNAVLAEAGGRLAVEVLFDRGTFDALATPHKRFHGILPYAAYRALMGSCEIAFMPLADTPFNNHKSDLKFVEAGAHRLAVLASPVVYGATVRHGKTGLLVRTPDDLHAALRRLLAHPEEAMALGEAAHGWVRGNRMLAGHVQRRLDWYRDLWARRAALDAAMLERAPEFARLG